MRRRFPKRPSQRAVANVLEFWSGGTAIKAATKRGRQPEGLTNDAIAAWAALRPGLVLGRNKRRLSTPPGMSAPIMLGWLVDHSSDWIGYRSVIVTADMVGKPIAQFVAIESKAGKNKADKGQQDFIDAVNAAGGVAGVVYNANDAEALLNG